MNELQLYLQSLKTDFAYDKNQYEINITKIESATTFYHQHCRHAFSDTHLYTVIRTSMNDNYILKIELSSGNIIWVKKMVLKNAYDSNQHIKITYNNGYIYLNGISRAKYNSSADNDLYPFAAKLDEDGNIIFNVAYSWSNGYWAPMYGALVYNGTLYTGGGIWASEKSCPWICKINGNTGAIATSIRTESLAPSFAYSMFNVHDGFALVSIGYKYVGLLNLSSMTFSWVKNLGYNTYIMDLIYDTESNSIIFCRIYLSHNF